MTSVQEKLTRPNPIRPTHKVAIFDCGEVSLNFWLVKHAITAAVGRTANTFVVCRGRRVVGYYSLANGAVAHKETSAKVRRNTVDPIPATILARLAVDNGEKGQGLGRDLLIDASRKVLLGARHTAAKLLVVHPLTSSATEFYKKFGFKKLRGDSDAMYIPVETLVDGL